LSSATVRTDAERVDVQLLVTYDCPNEAATATLLRLALNEAGLTDTDVRITVVTSPEQAEKLGFEGSPTILLDGGDPFARATPRQPALACRIYRTPDGPSGVPDFVALRQAIQRLVDAS
jgi:hypothetical protein